MFGFGKKHPDEKEKEKEIPPPPKEPEPAPPPEGVEGSGFNYRDNVIVTEESEKIGGIIVGIHGGGKQVDVFINQPGHTLHNYTKTYETKDVEPA